MGSGPSSAGDAPRRSPIAGRMAGSRGAKRSTTDHDHDHGQAAWSHGERLVIRVDAWSGVGNPNAFPSWAGGDDHR
jgi:hypothetical protein